MCSLASVQSLAHHHLCSGSPPDMEAIYRVAAAEDPGCDAAALIGETGFVFIGKFGRAPRRRGQGGRTRSRAPQIADTAFC